MPRAPDLRVGKVFRVGTALPLVKTGLMTLPNMARMTPRASGLLGGEVVPGLTVCIEDVWAAVLISGLSRALWEVWDNNGRRLTEELK